MGMDGQGLTIIGDIGVDLVLGQISGWPRMGTETIVEQSELRAGGSAANAALAVSYFGGHCRLLSAVGNDDFGAWLRDQLHGLDVFFGVCNAPTSMSVGLLHSHSERTFFTTRGHLEHFSYEQIRGGLLRARDSNALVLLSGVFLTPRLRSAYAQLIADLESLGYQLAIDTNWPPDDWSPQLRAEMAGWLAHCQHVLLNELEVTSLGDSADLEVAIERVARMLSPGATLVVKTGPRGAIGLEAGPSAVIGTESARRGAVGLEAGPSAVIGTESGRRDAVGLEAGRLVHCPAPRVSTFDTIGAGDAFNAGYLLARAGGADLPEALAAGCHGASNIIARFPRKSIARGELSQQLRALRAPVPEQT